jgi:hypothetical protein
VDFAMASTVSTDMSRGVAFSSYSWPPIIGWLLAIDFVLVTSYLVNHFSGAPFWKVTQLLDLNGEPTFATWYSAMKLGSIGLVLALACWTRLPKNGARDGMLTIVPLIFWMMSLDEVAQIHEWLGEKGDLLLPGGTRHGSWLPHTGFWMFQMGIPFAVFCWWLLRRAEARLPACSRGYRLLGLGMLIFLVGANGWEILSNYVYQQPDYYAIEAFAEELSEMTGATVMLWGALQLAADLGLEVRTGSGVASWLIPPPSPR